MICLVIFLFLKKKVKVNGKFFSISCFWNMVFKMYRYVYELWYMIYIFRMVAVNTEYVYIIYYHELLHIYVLRETRDHRTTTSFVYLASYTSSHSNYENWNNFPNFVSNYIVDKFSNLIIWIEIHPVWFISTYMLHNIHMYSIERTLIVFALLYI